MKNIQIVVTDNNTIVVIADTKRFGNHAIMFEGHTFMECLDYVRKMCRVDHFQLEAFPYTEVYTDTSGRTMPWMMDVRL